MGGGGSDPWVCVCNPLASLFTTEGVGLGGGGGGGELSSGHMKGGGVI